MGLGALAGQLKDLKLGELLDTPPPGLDEAVSIAKVGHHAASGLSPASSEESESCRGRRS